MKLKIFILTFLMMSCSIVFGQGTMTGNASNENWLKAHLADSDYGTIILANDIELTTGNIVIPNGRTVTIDLNGNTLSTTDNSTYIINNLGKLTIKDSNESGKGKISAYGGIYNGKTYNPNVRTAFGDVNINAKLTIESGVIEDISSDKRAVIYNYGMLYITGGKFYGKYSGITNYGMADIKNTYIECLGADNDVAAIVNDFDITFGENVYIAGEYRAVTGTAAYTGTPIFLYAELNGKKYLSLQDAINNAKTNETVTLIADNCKEDVTVTQAPDYVITIDGAEKTFKGTITVDGKSARYETTALTIKNVNFDATEGISADACINLGAKGNNNTRYTNNVTVENCTFTDNDYSSVAVKSYTGGDWNLKISNCIVKEGMHSLAQVTNVEKGMLISGCKVYSKNGINLNSSAGVVVENSMFETQGYAVRVGVDGGTSGAITLKNNTLKTDNSEGDAVIIVRGNAVTQVDLNMTENVVSGTTHISGNTKDTKINADENYWDGKEAPVATTPIVVNSYYSDAALTNLERNEMGSIYAFVSSDRIFGDVTTNAKESIKIEIIGKDGNLIGTSSLEKLSHITGFNKQLTWRINLGADNSDSWAMTWNEGNPSINNMPAKVRLHVDGEEVAEAEIRYTANGDGASPVFAAKTDAEGKINSFIACTGKYNLNDANTFLKEALTAGDNVAITVAGTYAVPTGKNLTITGAVDGVVFDNIGACNMGGANVTFNNVTFDYYPNVNYTGLQHSGNLVYNNCTINGQVFLYGTSETFNNCNFNQNSSDAYNVWTYGAKEVAFNECIFNSAGKSVLIYTESKTTFNDVDVTKCTFNASASVEGKAAIEMDSSLSGGIKLTIDDETTAEGFDEGNVSGNSLWNNKKGNDDDANNDITVVVDGETVLEPIYVAKIGEEGHRTLQEAINKVENGETITLLADCDETVHINKSNVAFTIDGKISETEKVDFSGVIGINIGQNVTITNIDFTGAKANHDFITNEGSPTGKNYNTTLLVEDCSFTGNSEFDVVGVRTKHPLHTQIVNCTADGLHSLLQNTGGQKVTVDEVVVTNGKEGGLALGGVRAADVKNSEITAEGYGVRVDAATKDAVFNIESSTFNAYIPVIARNATAANVNFTFSGENEMTQTNEDEVWFVIENVNSGYHNGNVSLETLVTPTGKVSVTLNDTGLDRNGIYGNYGVAKIGNATYNTFADALDAVKEGETIEVLDIEGSEANKEIDFTKEIEFTITGTAPNYALPVVTFQNATVNIKDAEILIPELDARQNATINVIDSKVYDAGGDGIVKSYYNGAIYIDANSTVYTMQVTTMGYITVAGTLNATWQTNVYGNGLITLNKGATFNTAALHLTAQDYSGRDNTDVERVGKPAEIIVDGANLTVGKVLSAGGQDYSYNSSKGINVGTVEGKSAILDIKNGANVNIYMANGETTNFGTGATVNVDASTLNTICRSAEGTATLANAGTVNVSGTSKLLAAKVTGNGWFYMNGVTLDADTKLLGAKVRFASGTNNIDGSTIDDGFFQVGIGAYNGTDANVDTENDVVVNVKNAHIGANGDTYAGWAGTGFYETDDEKAEVMTAAKYVLNIENSIAEFGYLHISNDGELNVKGNATEKVWYNNSDYSFYAGDFIINGTATFDATDVLALYTKVSCDNGTDNPGTLNIVNGTEYEAERHNGDIYGTNFTLYNTAVVNADANLHVGEYASIAADAKLNIGGTATILGTVTNNGTINFTSETATLTTPTTGLTVNNETDNNDIKVVYENGTYKFIDKHYVAEIVDGAKYESLADAATAAQDGETIQLLWSEGQPPIAMNASLYGKNVTITGTATVDWNKGFLFVGRGGEGNATLTFDGANLTSASNSSSYGIHVSGREKNTNNKYDGTLVIKNSTIELDYLINKGAITLDNSTLTVKNGFAVGGRPASETESGEDATATMTLTNNSKVIVDNHNGMGLGYEAIGVMNIDAASSFETTKSFLITAKGTMNVNGGNVKVAGTLTNNGTVYVTGEANLDATVTGNGWFYMNGVTLDADTKLLGAKVGFINGENNIVGSTIEDGFFSVGIGQNDAAAIAATFAEANGIELGNVTVNVSNNATIYTSTDAAYSGWVGSAFGAEKDANKYILNITNSLARFGYMHVSKDGELNATGRSDNKYEYAGYAVNFYAGNFINNGNVTLSDVDAWAQYSKISVDHSDAVLNITNGTKYEANCTTGNANNQTFLYYNAGTVNIDATSSVNISKATKLVEGAVLNIGGKVTAVGTVTNDGTINFTSETATLTTPTTGLTVNNETGNNDIKVVYENETYKFIDKDYVAEIVGGAKYESLAEAFNAAQDGEEIVVLKEIDLTAGVTVAADKVVVLDLNGKTISMQDASGKAAYAIKNNGNLTIKDSAKDGKITFNSTTPDNNFGYATSTIGNGGNLTIENGLIENTTVGGASYAIDGIWHTGEASLTINDGTIVAQKIAVRQVPFSATAKNTVTINGGTLTGETAGLQMFNINDDAKLSKTIIKGGTFNGTYAFYTSFTSAQASELATINIDGGTFNGYLYLYNGKHGSSAYPMTVTITDGNFEAEAWIYTYDDNGNEVPIKAISGGIFSVDPSKYCAENYGAFLYDATSWIVREIYGEQTFDLVAGWNWVSSYITEFEGDEGLAMLQEGLGENGIQIKNDDYTSTYRNNGWSGKLTSVSVDEMYKVNMSAGVNFKFEGSFVNYDEQEIVLRPGWNYIGYPVNVETNLANALVILSADGNEEYDGANVGDVIKSQQGTATYIGSSAWIFGNQFNLIPGEGYMYKNTSDEVKILRYTTKNAATSSETETNTRSSNHWTVDVTQYPSNMTMIAMTDVEGGNYEVAAFVNGEVRGSSRPVYVESLDAYILILTISGDDVEEMTFKYYDLTTGEEVEFSNRINYSNDAIVGSINEPYMLTRGTTGIGEAAMSNINIYPNPTTTGTEINLQATCDKVEVFNALGAKVAEYQNVDSIDALETAGIYVIRITNNGNVQNCRLVVK